MDTYSYEELELMELNDLYRDGDITEEQYIEALKQIEDKRKQQPEVHQYQNRFEVLDTDFDPVEWDEY